MILLEGYPFKIPRAKPTAKLEARGRRVIDVKRKLAICVRDAEPASKSFS